MSIWLESTSYLILEITSIKMPFKRKRGAFMVFVTAEEYHWQPTRTWVFVYLPYLTQTSSQKNVDMEVVEPLEWIAQETPYLFDADS